MLYDKYIPKCEQDVTGVVYVVHYVFQGTYKIDKNLTINGICDILNIPKGINDCNIDVDGLMRVSHNDYLYCILIPVAERKL